LNRLRIALGLLWLLDGVLQLQPAMFTQDFVTSLEQNVMAQPPWFAHTILRMVAWIGPHIAIWNGAFAVLQLGLGTGILWPRTSKLALGLSCVWALALWWFGEGLGSILTGFGSLLAGAPGAALLYAITALVVWPTTTSGGTAPAGAGLLGEHRTRGVWAALWCGVAYLQVKPGLSFSYRAAANFQELSIGEPSYLMHLDHAMQRFGQRWGTPLSIALAAIEVLVGVGVVVGRSRRMSLGASFFLLAAVWVLGQNAGALLTGSGTDPGAAPLFGLLALALWPVALEERPTADGRAGRARRTSTMVFAPDSEP